MKQDTRDMITFAPNRHRLAGLLSALALLMATSQAWSAGSVSTLADSGPGSLRAAVVGGGAVPIFVTGTIVLTSGQITVPNGTTISAVGANQLSVSGNNASRVFDIALASTVSIAGVTVTAGNAGSGGQGGAIRNAGTLTLTGVAVSANTAGDAGGGIYSSGTLNVSNSVFNGNSVSAVDCAGGGAIRSEGAAAVLTLTNSTVTQNTAASCSGGGISFSGASATITGSTISANTAGSSGGNLYKGSAAAAMTMVGSVVSDGVAGGGTPMNVDLHGALGGGFVSSGYNLVKSRGDSAGYVASDLADGTAPLLSGLAANSGTTATLAFAIGSPLRDAAGACALATDQRGFTRPQGPSCDIGAFEYRVSSLGVSVTGVGSVTASAPPAPIEGGITNCAGSCTATYDGEVAPTITLVATPGSGQLFAGWGGDCSGSNATTTVAMSAARSCTATFNLSTVTVTSSVSGGNGSINPVGAQTVNAGSSLVFTLAPAANYHVVTPVGGSCGGNLSGNTYTTNAVTADCTVIASFAIDQHTVTPSVTGGNGTITPSTPQLVNYNAATIFTLAPAANYHVVTPVGGSCGGSLSGTTYTTNAVTADCTVIASFAIDQHTVTPSVTGGNGTITPSTPQLVNSNATTVFTLAPAANYHVVTPVGGSCGGTLSGTSYTTNAVTADCTVIASFAIDQHTVTPSVTGGNGTITPSTPQLVNSNATTVFTLAPAANYHVVTPVGGTCGGSLSGTTYTTNVVTTDCTVIASFAIDQYTVTPSIGTGTGSITPSTPQLVDHGATTIFTLAPAAHYHLVDVTGSCGGSVAGNIFTTSAINSDCTVVANFAIDTHTIGGSVSGLVGSALVLRLNGGNDILVMANGGFTFTHPLDDLGTYTVTIAQQPITPTQVCSVTDGTGTLAGSDITNIAVVCQTPIPHFSVSTTDNHDYARYGMLLNYVVTVTNDGTGDASGVSVSNISPAQLDATNTHWICQSSGGGATCGASGVGALNDTGVSIPIGRSLTWIVTAPLLFDAPGTTVDYTVNVSGPASATATDSDILVILRTGFDVPYGDGAETAIEGPDIACTTSAVNASSDRFDLATTRTFTLSASAARSAVDTVFAARSDGAAGFRIERLNTSTVPRVRLVTVDKGGIERANAWNTAPVGTVLTIATVAAGSERELLLEGIGVSSSMPLPQGVNGTVNVRNPTGPCE
ncbi:MAG: choice-of-anchor Q domain-containing protein [Dokdonella sp.]